MKLGDLADNQLPELEILDSCDKAMGFMDEFKLSHYPVINGSLFVGLIYEEDVYEFEDWSQTISQCKIRLPNVSVNENEHFLTAVQKMTASGLSVIPVVDEKNFYRGMITNDMIVQVFGNSSIVQDIGGVIEIEIAPQDYYLTEITRIIESTGTKILGSYIRNIPDDHKIVVTLKLNTQEVEEVLSALDRFGYVVFASYNLKSEDSLRKDRYDNLMQYLNI